MLYRKAVGRIEQWKNGARKRALLVTGARQTGKTFLVRSFAKEHYKHVAEINFIADPGASAIFEGKLDASTLLANLTAYLRMPMPPRETLLFLDEIQECPAARAAVKFLVEDGRLDVIESGSLLGVQYKEVPSYPVGYEERLTMYPLDFEEFAMANGVQPVTFERLRECFERGAEVGAAAHAAMSELFRQYVIVGGMPAAVQEFVNTRDLAQTAALQSDILALYRQDIAKYALNDKDRVKRVFDRIPDELNAQNRRFLLADIQKSARMNRYESSFLWLADAGVALPCYNVSEPKPPLRLKENDGLFKLFLCDTGLLCAAGMEASMENVQFEILQGDLSVNMGGILENAVAQSLVSNGFQLRYFKQKSRGEVDFLLQRGKAVVPVEVKSGAGYKRHAALDNVLGVREWGLSSAYVLCEGDVQRNGRVTYVPWYMVSFLRQDPLPPGAVAAPDLSVL